MKKFLSIALALLMVCVMLPVVALADEGITTEQALTDAITAATNGATITLGGDIELTATIEITAGKNLTIDLNGQTIKNGSALGTDYILWNHGTLVLTNGSIIDSRSNVTGNCTAIRNTGTLTLDGVTATREGSIVVKNDDNDDNNAERGTMVVRNSTISSKTVTAEGKSVAGQAIQNWCTATIYSGTFNADVNTWSYGNVGGNTVIKGGTFNGDVNSLQYKYNNSWPIPAAKTSIEGGTINGSIGVFFQEGGQLSDTATEVPEETTKAALTVSGGTFTTDKENAEKYLEEGLKLNANGEVVPKSTTIVITTPSEDTTPKTDDQKNPSTGANDFVGLAAAAAVVALLGSAVVLRKK